MNRILEGVRIFLLASLLMPASGLAQQSGPWVSAIGTPQYFAVIVADVDRVAAWYRTVLGLRELDDSSAQDGSWRIVNLKNEHLAVEIIRDDRSVPGVRDRGFFKVGFQVPDVEPVAALAEKDSGVRPRIIDDSRHGLRILQLEDPEGNVLQLTSPLKRP